MTGRAPTASKSAAPARPGPGNLRHKRTLKKQTELSKPAVKRICRRAGTKRLTSKFLDEVRSESKDFLQRLLRNAIIYAKHFNRQTVMSRDVLLSLKQSGQTLYVTDTD